MSTDRFYINSSSISTSIGFTSLNTEIFDYHNWELNFTSGYKAADKKYLWGLPNGSTLKIESEKLSNLIFLGDSKNMKKGYTIQQSLTHGETLNKTTF